MLDNVVCRRVNIDVVSLKQLIVALVTTAISKQDRAPRLFTQRTTVSPVTENHTDSHVTWGKMLFHPISCALPDFRGKCDWLEGSVM